MPYDPYNPQATLNPTQPQGSVRMPTPVNVPWPLIPYGPDVLHQTRRKTQMVQGAAVDSEQTMAWKMDTQTIVWGLTGSAVYVGEGTSPGDTDTEKLDWFTIKFENTNEKLDDGMALGSNVLGKGREPALVGLHCWRFVNNATLTALVSPRFADIDIYVTIWCVQLVGNGNCAT
jgi:hypothetical protein